MTSARIPGAEEGAAIYVHLPFCETKCPYCDFNSFAREGRDVGAYVDALLAEFAARGLPAAASSVFLGGGTPTMLEPDELERVCGALAAGLRPDPAREYTAEANPGSLTADKLAVLRAHGANRLSIGAQSLDDRHLATLGRVHRAGDVARAVALARDAGFPQVSLDFIYAIPGQTMREWADTLDAALALGPDHLSCYALTWEPGTAFTARRDAGRLRAAPEASELAMFRYTERRLRAAGFPRYEISNFAPPGRECRHNLNYWANGSYAGYGAGAHSFLDGERSANERHLGRYRDAVAAHGHAVVSRERLGPEDAARETLVFGLRTALGVDLRAVGARHGVALPELIEPVLAPLAAAGYVERAGTRVRLARRGWRVADEVMAALL